MLQLIPSSPLSFPTLSYLLPTLYSHVPCDSPLSYSSLSASALFSPATPSSREDQREEGRSRYLYSSPLSPYLLLPLISFLLSPSLLLSSYPLPSLPLYSSPLLPYLLSLSTPPLFSLTLPTLLSFPLLHYPLSLSTPLLLSPFFSHSSLQYSL